MSELGLPECRRTIDRVILQTMVDHSIADFGVTGTFHWLRNFESEWLPRDVVRGILRDLTDRGYCQYKRGLFTDGGEPAGSGYGITLKGLEYLKGDRGMSGWQPMETAPLDGTPVLLFATVAGWEDCGYTRCVGYYNARSWTAYGPAFGEPVKRKNGRNQRSPQNITDCKPARWQPLPDPPKETET